MAHSNYLCDGLVQQSIKAGDLCSCQWWREDCLFKGLSDDFFILIILLSPAGTVAVISACYSVTLKLFHVSFILTELP